MSRQIGTLKISSNFEPRMGAPLDARSIVPLKTDLTAAGTFDYTYVGMIVVVQEEGKAYILQTKPTTVLTNWRVVGDDQDLSNYYTKSEVDEIVSRVYKPVGSCLFAELPDTLTSSLLGYVYDVTDDFTTDTRFAEGAGHAYPGGTNVVVINAGDELLPIYKFDVLPGFIDLSSFQLKMQMDTLPTASSELEGRIFQYTGADTAILTGGFFYKCVEDTENPGTYIWQEALTQPADPNGLGAEVTVTKDVGGITAGTVYPIGTKYDDLWEALLSPTLYPTLVAPSATLTATGTKLLEKGDTLSTTMTVEFDRGSITPAYGTNGYRAGEAGSYSLNSGTAQVSNVFSITVDESVTSFQASVNYGAGPQPKDSDGEDYSTPLPAGNVATNIINYEFVNALWANTASISVVQKIELVSADAKLKAFSFPAATIANPEVFDVPASWTITHVEVLNTLSNQWEDCSTEFTITDVTHPDAADTSVAYKRYTCNLGYDMGIRQIRIKWS